MNEIGRTSSFARAQSFTATQPIDYDAVEDPPIDPFANDSDDAAYAVPRRQYPPLSRCDTIFGLPDGTLVSVHGKANFVTDDQLIKVHPVKQLNKFVAVTQEGKHTALQQAHRSCVPSVITLLALDLKGTPLFQEMVSVNLTSDETELVFIRKAGFEPIVYSLKGYGMQKADTLAALLKKGGPGILHVYHPDLKSHVIVLDDISIKDGSATFRDTYHGWMITMKLGPFLDWIGDQFVQFGDRLHKAAAVDAS